MDALAAIRDTFFQECEEQLAALETGLLALDDGDTDPETVNAVFRAVHSIKGGAGAFGLEELVRFSHVFETALDDVRAGKLALAPPVLKTMLRAADALADLVRAAQGSGPPAEPERIRRVAEEVGALGSAAAPPPIVSAPIPGEDIEGLVFQPLQVELPSFGLDEAALPAGSVGQAWTVRFRPAPALYAKANEAAVLLRELSQLGAAAIELDASGVPGLPELDPEGACLAWTIRLNTAQPEAAIREVFEFVEGDCELDISADDAPPDALPSPEAAPMPEIDVLALIEGARLAAPSAPPPSRAEPQAAQPSAPPAAPGGALAKPTIRVDLERVDRLIDLVGELVINQAMLAQRVAESGLSRSSNMALGLDDLEHLTRDIQESVMAIRAQPVRSVFQRMPRLVREVAAMTGKSVRLLTEGEGTEVDKTVIEHLADPLTHMIRNAIDHGLESPDKRAAAGKPAEGTVRLLALHRSGRIVIEVSDDGGGIDRARVKAIAADKGLIPPDAVLSDEDADNLIFLPGFSTADKVSDISGRGVGMDVVRRSIMALGGRIAIASRPGLGSTFTMSLPLTLAVLDGMVVTVEGQTLVVPLTGIIETLQPRARDVHSLGTDARLIAIRGSYVPLVDVGHTLRYRDAPAPAAAGVALLVEGEGGIRTTLLVDAIQGQRQVVIKSLEANYRHVPGIAAATILGDGRVALILDIDAVVAASRTEQPDTRHDPVPAAGVLYHA